MAYSATVIPVMIASPGDVAEEREIARQVIHDWNDVNSQRSQVMLAAVGWDTHSSPELGCRPQELINKRVLRDCDLLVGIFWTRLGTPTGNALSGTIEEVEEHVAAGKPAMIYFSLKPASLETVEVDQFNKVKEVRRAWQERGLVETYENIEQFRQKLAKQLQLCLHKNDYLAGLVAERVSLDGASSESNGSDAASPLRLSADAIELLKAASLEEDGVILKVQYLDGQEIQTGSRTFGKSSKREFSRWEAALNNLIEEDLVIERGYKGEYFELTHVAWALADSYNK